MATASGTDFARIEAQVQAHSSALRQELGLGDVMLALILSVVVPDFFGTAVQAGASHVVLWLFAIALFFVPQALVVAHLNRLMPLEGGLYEWARLAFNDRIGFMVAFNLWLFGTLYTAVIGLISTTFLAYVIGPQAAWLASNKWLVFAASALFIAAVMIVARLGLSVGRWVMNAGAFVVLSTLGVLVLMPLVNVWRGTLAEYHPLRLVAPPLTFLSLSLFGKMTFGALSGLEYVAIFAGESRNPARNYLRAIAATAPLIALLYIFGTSAILAFVSPDSIDFIGPIPQALSQAAHSHGLARLIVRVSILLLLLNYLSNFTLNFSGNSRLPMVAGWDRLLPGWFSRLDPTRKTPVNSILLVGGVAFAAATAALLGAEPQEAYELLLIWSFTFFGLAYLALFAIPLFARRDTGLRPKLWLRLASASGLLVTLLFVLLSVFPVIPVPSKSAYVAKSIAVLVGANALGLLIYRFGRQSGGSHS